MVTSITTAAEQLQIELINRARLDPAGEAARLGINLNEGLAAGTISASAREPLAVADGLRSAAQSHSQFMINVDKFGHDGIGDGTISSRTTAFGYTGALSKGENIAARSGTSLSLTAIQTYEDLFIDSGIVGRGHRLNILSSNFSEVGVGIKTGWFKFPSGQTFNSTLVTQDFGNRGKVFLTGVAYNDTNGNKFYDIGEARSNVVVTSNVGGSANSGVAGGYELETMAVASRTIKFSGGGLATAVNATVSLGTSDNVKVDLVGTNSIYSSGNTTLGAGALHLTLLGTNGLTGIGNNGVNVINGNRGNNVLFGQSGSDTLLGNDGNDVLHGGIGADKLLGGNGHDTLLGGAGADVLNGGTGVNTASYLGSTAVTANLTTSSANTGDAQGDTYGSIVNLIGSQNSDVLVGNAVANRIQGVTGHDALFGLAGNDRVEGGAGFDFLDGGLGGDILNGGTEFDFALYSFATTAITANLANKALNTGEAAGDSYVSIEGLGGSKFNDKLVGDTIGNVLNGGLGKDTLTGGAGADAFVFSTALNTTTNVDTITDFTSGSDQIWLQKAGVFTKLPLGGLATTSLQFGPAAVDANDFIIYNSATGKLFYDSNANVAGGMIQFAQFTPGTSLSPSDIIVT